MRKAQLYSYYSIRNGKVVSGKDGVFPTHESAKEALEMVLDAYKRGGEVWITYREGSKDAFMEWKRGRLQDIERDIRVIRREIDRDLLMSGVLGDTSGVPLPFTIEGSSVVQLRRSRRFSGVGVTEELPPVTRRRSVPSVIPGGTLQYEVGVSWAAYDTAQVEADTEYDAGDYRGEEAEAPAEEEEEGVRTLPPRSATIQSDAVPRSNTFEHMLEESVPPREEHSNATLPLIDSLPDLLDSYHDQEPGEEPGEEETGAQGAEHGKEDKEGKEAFAKEYYMRRILRAGVLLCPTNEPDAEYEVAEAEEQVSRDRMKAIHVNPSLESIRQLYPAENYSVKEEPFSYEAPWRLQMSYRENNPCVQPVMAVVRKSDTVVWVVRPLYRYTLSQYITHRIPQLLFEGLQGERLQAARDHFRLNTLYQCGSVIAETLARGLKSRIVHRRVNPNTIYVLENTTSISETLDSVPEELVDAESGLARETARATKWVLAPHLRFVEGDDMPTAEGGGAANAKGYKPSADDEKAATASMNKMLSAAFNLDFRLGGFEHAVQLESDFARDLEHVQEMEGRTPDADPTDPNVILLGEIEHTIQAAKLDFALVGAKKEALAGVKGTAVRNHVNNLTLQNVNEVVEALQGKNQPAATVVAGLVQKIQGVVTGLRRVCEESPACVVKTRMASLSGDPVRALQAAKQALNDLKEVYCLKDEIAGQVNELKVDYILYQAGMKELKDPLLRIFLPCVEAGDEYMTPVAKEGATREVIPAGCYVVPVSSGPDAKDYHTRSHFVVGGYGQSVDFRMLGDALDHYEPATVKESKTSVRYAGFCNKTWRESISQLYHSLVQKLRLHYTKGPGGTDAAMDEADLGKGKRYLYNQLVLKYKEGLGPVAQSPDDILMGEVQRLIHDTPLAREYEVIAPLADTGSIRIRAVIAHINQDKQVLQYDENPSLPGKLRSQARAEWRAKGRNRAKYLFLQRRASFKLAPAEVYPSRDLFDSTSGATLVHPLEEGGTLLAYRSANVGIDVSARLWEAPLRVYPGALLGGEMVKGDKGPEVAEVPLEDPFNAHARGMAIRVLSRVVPNRVAPIRFPDEPEEAAEPGTFKAWRAKYMALRYGKVTPYKKREKGDLNEYAELFRKMREGKARSPAPRDPAFPIIHSMFLTGHSLVMFAENEVAESAESNPSLTDAQRSDGLESFARGLEKLHRLDIVANDLSRDAIWIYQTKRGEVKAFFHNLRAAYHRYGTSWNDHVLVPVVDATAPECVFKVYKAKIRPEDSAECVLGVPRSKPVIGTTASDVYAFGVRALQFSGPNYALAADFIEAKRLHAGSALLGLCDIQAIDVAAPGGDQYQFASIAYMDGSARVLGNYPLEHRAPGAVVNHIAREPGKFAAYLSLPDGRSFIERYIEGYPERRRAVIQYFLANVDPAHRASMRGFVASHFPTFKGEGKRTRNTATWGRRPHL